MAITVWCLRTFRDHEGQDLASDSDEQMLIYIPGMHVCVGDQNWHDWGNRSDRPLKPVRPVWSSYSKCKLDSTIG